MFPLPHVVRRLVTAGIDTPEYFSAFFGEGWISLAELWKEVGCLFVCASGGDGEMGMGMGMGIG